MAQKAQRETRNCHISNRHVSTEGSSGPSSHIVFEKGRRSQLSKISVDEPRFNVIKFPFEQLSLGDRPLIQKDTSLHSFRGPKNFISKGQAPPSHGASTNNVIWCGSNSVDTGPVQEFEKKTTRGSRKIIPWLAKQQKGDQQNRHDENGEDSSDGRHSRVSESSRSSRFAPTCTKLKRFLKKGSHYNFQGKISRKRKGNFLSPEGNLPGSENGRKQRKCLDDRHSSPLGNATFTNAAFGNDAISPIKERLSSYSGHKSEVEAKPMKSVSFISALQLCKKEQVASEGPPSALPTNKASNVTEMHAFALPWSDLASSGKLQGLYSGPVNGQMQPHGEGSLVLQNDNLPRFYGQWSNGQLVSPLEDKCGWTRRGRHSSSSHHSSRQGKEPSNENKKLSEGQGGKEYTDERKKKRITSPSPPISIGSNIDKELEYPSSVDSSARTTPNNSASQKPRQHKRKYKLGQAARSPQDMIIHAPSKMADLSVSSLKKNDLAFLKRTNGLWTCAILTERALQPTIASDLRWYAEDEIDAETMELEESMLFVIDEAGSTKIVKRRYWGRFIRCMRADGNDEERDSHNNSAA